MEKKKVVSIEDHLPKLKQARKKKANRRLIFYLFIFFLLISIIVYLQSSLSDVKTISIKGNDLLEKEEVINLSGLEINSNIWAIQKNKVEKILEKNPIIDTVEVERKLPWTVIIHVKEFEHVGYVKMKKDYYPILDNEKVVKLKKNIHVRGDAPILHQFTDDTYLSSMVQELNVLTDSITSLISEIYWVPSKKNKHKIVVYMNDGQIVSSTIRDFATKMEMYPSIVSQLDLNKKGIIHIGVGTYFEEFKK